MSYLKAMSHTKKRVKTDRKAVGLYLRNLLEDHPLRWHQIHPSAAGLKRREDDARD